MKKYALKDNQKQHGEKRLEEFASFMGVDKAKAIFILSNIKKIRWFFDWVNADRFLNEKQNEVQPQGEDQNATS